mmetsp:Transcript_14522/g.42533  ORF Transcript_14522/g.42533 Transcript_14522/m.42533 type:complete len:379 (+) Transcript_14522:1826-2962(+)
MGAVHGLEVDLRVPVGIKQHHNVRRGKVDPQPSRASAQNEAELVRPFPVEVLHLIIAAVAVSTAVDPAVAVLHEAEVILQHVQHARHLGEDEYARSAGFELGKELVKELKLGGILPQVRTVGVGRAGLGAVKEVRMIAHLAQLHEDVEESDLGGSPQGVQFVRVLGQDLLVPLLLHGGQSDEQLGLLLGGEGVGDVLLDATEHERPQDGVELLDDVLLPVRPGHVEPLVELLGVSKDFGKEEIQQRPQFVEVVLEGSAGDEETELGVHGPHYLAEGRILVLDPVGLVDDEVLPVDLPQWALLLEYPLVRRDEYVKGVLPRSGILGQILSHDLGPGLLVPRHLDGLDGRTPMLDLLDPVPQHRLGDYHDVRTLDSAGFP